MHFFLFISFFCTHTLFADITVLSEAIHIARSITTLPTRQELTQYQETIRMRTNRVAFLLRQQGIPTTIETINIALQRNEELTETDCKIINQLSDNNLKTICMLMQVSSEQLKDIYKKHYTEMKSIQENSVKNISKHDYHLAKALEKMTPEEFHFFKNRYQDEMDSVLLIARDYTPRAKCTIADELRVIRLLLNMPSNSQQLFLWQLFDVAKYIVARESWWKSLLINGNSRILRKLI